MKGEDQEFEMRIHHKVLRTPTLRVTHTGFEGSQENKCAIFSTHGVINQQGSEFGAARAVLKTVNISNFGIDQRRIEVVVVSTTLTFVRIVANQ